MDNDTRHLDLLAIFHYVVAAIMALAGCIPILHLVLGIAIAAGAFDENNGDSPPRFIGFIFIGIAAVIIAAAWAMAAAVCLAAVRLQRRTNYTYCLVVACIECTFMPFGTVLGVLTIVVLMRPTVQTLFGRHVAPIASS